MQVASFCRDALIYTSLEIGNLSYTWFRNESMNSPPARIQWNRSPISTWRQEKEIGNVFLHVEVSQVGTVSPFPSLCRDRIRNIVA